MDNATSQKSNESIITDHYTEYRQDKLRALEKKIRKSRNTLFIVAAVMLVAGLFQLSGKNSDNGREFMFTIFLSLVFLALGFFTKKEPFGALVMALVIYVGLWFLSAAVFGPQYLFKGIIAKGIIIFYMASGIPHASQAEDLKKELKESKE